MKPRFLHVRTRKGSKLIKAKPGPSRAVHFHGSVSGSDLHPWTDYGDDDMSFYKNTKTAEPVKLLEQDGASNVTYENKAGEKTTVQSHVFFGEHTELTEEEVDALRGGAKAPAK